MATYYKHNKAWLIGNDGIPFGVAHSADGSLAVMVAGVSRTYEENQVDFGDSVDVSTSSRVTVGIKGLARNGDTVTVAITIGTASITYWTFAADGDVVLEVVPTVSAVSIERTGANATATSMWISTQS